MATVKGQNLRIMFDQGDPEVANPGIAGAVNCTLHVNADIQEDTTKDQVDDWLTMEVVGMTWDIRTEALIFLDEQSSTGIEVSDMTVGMSYNLIFARTTGEKNREAVQNTTYYRGTAILTDLQLNAQNTEVSQYTAQFTGTGDLQEIIPESA
jgi:predicted secreted protein